MGGVGGSSIPIVDLSLHRSVVTEIIGDACREWGGFQLINHGLPADIADIAFAACRQFHDQPGLYECDRRRVKSLMFTVSPRYNGGLKITLPRGVPANAAATADTVGDAVATWDASAVELVREVLGFMSEGLGLEPWGLQDMWLLEERQISAIFYPAPAPELGERTEMQPHTDPSVITLLKQDGVGGLQVMKRSSSRGDLWVDVEPLQGALIILVGAFLQMVTNDEYKGGVHRVKIDHQHAPTSRMSLATFFIPLMHDDGEVYGPMPELTVGMPQRYRSFTIGEYEDSLIFDSSGKRDVLGRFRL